MEGHEGHIERKEMGQDGVSQVGLDGRRQAQRKTVSIPGPPCAFPKQAKHRAPRPGVSTAPHTHQAVMRYWARAIETGEPVMVTCRSPAPSAWFPILMCAPDICRISLILLPWRPITQPISFGVGERRA